MKINIYKNVLQNKTYQKLFIARFCSELGSVTSIVAFMFYILDRFSEQPSYATITEMMYALPTLFVFLFTGVLADRLDRQKIAVYCDWICAVISALLLLSVHNDWIIVTFALIFLRSAVNKFFNPAQSAIVQGVVSKEDYPTAIGLNQMLASLFFLTGSGIGALVYWKIGIEGAIWIDIISFLVSGFLIKRCDIPFEVRRPNANKIVTKLNFKGILNDFSAGIKYVVKEPIVFALLGGILILGVFNGGEAVIHIFIMKYKLAPESYEEIQIVIASAMASGVLIGSFFSTHISKKVALYKMIIASFIIPGVVLFFQAMITSIPIYLALNFILGFCVPLCNVAFFGWLGQIVEPAMMGRVQGLITPLMMITLAATQGFIAIAYPKIVTIEMIFYLVGGSALLLGLYYAILLPRLAKNRDSSGGLKEATEQAG